MTDASATAEKQDLTKWISAAALLVAGVLAFYFFSNFSLLVRILILVGFIAGGVYLIYTTAKGKSIVEFLQDTNIEVRKVVWPSRQEALQTTGIVIVMVLVLAIFVWMLDSLLFWIVRLFTGQGA